MTQDVAPSLEDRLRAALTEVAEHVSVDQLPAMWSDEDGRRAPSRRLRTLAVVALAASLAVGAAIAVQSAGSKSVSHPPPATSSSAPTTTPPAVLTCPSRPAKRVVPHQVPGTDTDMVPGAPTELLACRYRGLNQSEPLGSLAKSASFAPGPIAAALNARPALAQGVVQHCPADFSDTILLLFAYADGSKLSILVDTSGCRYALNGDRVIHMDLVTLGQLQAVLGKDSSP